MPNHKSAIKRAKQSIKRRTTNRHWLSSLRSDVKDVRTAITGADTEAAKGALPVAIRSLQRAAAKGIIHRNAARRTISRLTKQVNGLG